MAAYTVRDLVRDALLDAGVIGMGATPGANEAADAVRTLNRILDGYALEGLTSPGVRRLSVAYPAGAEFVEFVRGVAVEPWQVAVPEIVMRPNSVAILEGVTRLLPYMDVDAYFGRNTTDSGYVYAWHWEDTQNPRLFLADAPASGASLEVVVPCDPHRDVDLNTDLSAWRVGLRPLLCADLAVELARQNQSGMDVAGLAANAARFRALYKRTIRTPLSMRLDGSAPGMRGVPCDIVSGNWM